MPSGILSFLSVAVSWGIPSMVWPSLGRMLVACASQAETDTDTETETDTDNDTEI